MAKKHIERCSVPLVIRDTWIKTTMRYYFALGRKAVIKNPVSVGRICRNWITQILLVEMWNGAATLFCFCSVNYLLNFLFHFMVQILLQNVIHRGTTLWLRSPRLGMYPGEMWVSSQKHSHMDFHRTIFVMAKNRNNPNDHRLTDEWTKRGILIYCNVIWSQKGNGILIHAGTWKLQNPILS